MKKLFYIAAPFLSINLYASAVFMGGLASVAGDGAFDAARNPAIMAWAVTDAFGVLGQYNVYREADIKIKIDSPAMTNGKIAVKDNGTLNGNLCLSYLSKGDRSAFGISIVQNDDFQYSVSESAQKFSADIGIDSFENISSKKETQINSALIIAGGWMLTEKSSFGLSLKTGYSKNFTTEEIINRSTLTADDYDSSVKKSSAEINSELIFGWIFKEGPIEVGAVITSGRMVYTNSDYENKFNDITAPYQNTFNKSTSTYYYNSMPAVVIGIYSRPFAKFAFAGEAVYLAGGDWRESHFDFDENLRKVETVSSKMTVSPAFIFKGGIELFVADNFIISAGLSYLKYKMDMINTNMTFQSNIYEMTLISGITGVEFLYGKNSRLFLGSKVTSVKSEGRMNLSFAYIELNDTTISVDTYIGASFGF